MPDPRASQIQSSQDTDMHDAMDAVDWTVLKALCRDAGHEMIQELMRLYVNDTREQLQRLTQAFLRHDRAGIGQVAHSLKSSSANVGAHRLSALCAQLEARCKDVSHPMLALEDAQELAVAFDEVHLLFEKELSFRHHL